MDLELATISCGCHITWSVLCPEVCTVPWVCVQLSAATFLVDFGVSEESWSGKVPHVDSHVSDLMCWCHPQWLLAEERVLPSGWPGHGHTAARGASYFPPPCQKLQSKFDI